MSKLGYTPKYELTEWFMRHAGEKVYRIRALHDFDEVKAGDLGWYVLGPHNLSHEGNCWLSQYSIATDQSRVSGNAWALDRSRLANDAQLMGNAYIFNNALLRGACIVEGTVQLYNHVVVGGRMHLTGDLRFSSQEELSEYISERKLMEMSA